MRFRSSSGRVTPHEIFLHVCQTPPSPARWSKDLGQSTLKRRRTLPEWSSLLVPYCRVQETLSNVWGSCTYTHSGQVSAYWHWESLRCMRRSSELAAFKRWHASWISPSLAGWSSSNNAPLGFENKWLRVLGRPRLNVTGRSCVTLAYRWLTRLGPF